MPSTMLVHDTRLAGTAPGIANNTYLVDGNVPIQHAVGWMAAYARSSGRLSSLALMCHGIEGLVYDTQGGQCDGALGFGLQLCKEGFTWGTMSSAYALSGLVDTITIYACGPANTRPGFSNTAADGFRFCSELAAIVQAEVIAAVENQYYHQGASNLLRRIFLLGPQDTISFGDWEGTVYRFSPDGSATTL